MIIRKSQATAPLDRPFPDENTVAEMYCNEAYTIDNEAVEDWTSSLQMLQTFAAIFSAVLITLIVDSKTLLQQDTNEAILDAVVFLMNDLANGTHRPYSPPKFQPSTQSILVNCFFFASLCLSIATALAAVLAMQWVTDYGAVTRRAGSTPEERVKRRHFRYQGGQDWRMDTIIGALPIALHLSVLLFFVGLIVWMWDVHHSVFAVVIICGAFAALFYIFTTALAVLCPSCPYRTPLASWIYTLLHFLIAALSRLPWLLTLETQPEGKIENGETTTSRRSPPLRRLVTSLHSRFGQASLSLRDDVYVQGTAKTLLQNPLVWLSNHISISPDVYRRLLIFVDGFSLVVDKSSGAPLETTMPWRNIFRVLGVIYQSFVGDLAWSEDEFVEFARRTHCLSQPGLNKILESVSGSDEVDVGNDLFPVRLLHVWAKSTSLHNSDSLRKQRFSDEVVLRDLISNISPTSQDLLQTWSELLGDEEKTCDLILPRVLEGLKSSVPEKMEQRLDIALYLISTRGLPWGTTVQLYEEYWRKKMVAPNVLTRRFRSTDWVDSLLEHPLKELILERLRDLSHQTSRNIILMHNKVTDEEKAELELMGLDDLARWTRTEEMLYSALTTFDRMLSSAEDQEGSGSTQDMIGCIVTISQADLMRPDLSLDPTYFDADWRRATLQHLSNPILQLIASATLGFEWNEELLPNLLKARDLLSGRTWETVSEICFKDSPFSKGDQTPLWQLRFQLWIHFSPIVPHNFLYNVIIDLDSLKRIEEELQSSKLGIDHAGDFFIAFFHVHYPYGWKPFSSSYLTFIPDILSGNAILAYPSGITTDIIDYLSAICHEISLDPARLIRLLVELIRADINHNPQERRPGDLLNVLKHVETHLSGKELQQLFPSCQQLSRSIRISYKQFEDSWDGVLDGDYNYEDPRPFYIMVDREDLKVVYERVVTLLESVEVFEGEKKEALWPRYLLRPTGTHDKPFKEDVEEMSSHKAKGGDNGDEEKKDNEDEVEKQQVKAVGELYQDRVDQDQNGTHLTDQPVGESDVP